MGQTERLMDIWLYIVRHRAFTAGELAQRFGVSPRTIVRDLDQLSVIGVPLYTVQGKGGGYRVLDSISLPPVSFSEDELNSILFAYHLLDLIGDNPLGVETQAVREKLLRQMPDYIREKSALLAAHMDFMTPKRQTTQQWLRDIYLASLSRMGARLRYAAQDGESAVDCFPIGVYAWEGFWYAVGYVAEADRYRIFRVDRVLSFEPLPEALPPQDLWTLSEWEHRGFSQQGSVRIVLELTPRALRGLVNPWMHRGTVEATPEGAYRLSFECPESQVRFIVPEILRLGADARVIEPDDIVRQVVDALKRALKNYES